MDQTSESQDGVSAGGAELKMDPLLALCVGAAAFGCYAASNVAAIFGGSVFKSFKENTNMDALKELDRTPSARFEGLRRPNTASSAVENRTGASTFVKPSGSIRLINQGSAKFNRIQHTWVKSPYSNLSSGTYREKALLAMQAEGNTFDTSFYRMDRRDSDKLYG